MKAKVRLSALAASHVRTIDAWWREERPAAPALFYGELAEALELLSRSPRSGIRYKPDRVAGVRRFLLRSTRYHVYYREAESSIVVLGVWSAVRGRVPDLRELR